jgi:hypothetical protein
MMEAKIRLDGSGTPYLSITYVKPVQDDSVTSAQDDAERLFFDRINDKGVSAYVTGGNAPGTQKVGILVTAGALPRRPATNSERQLIGFKPEVVEEITSTLKTLTETLNNSQSAQTAPNKPVPVESETYHSDCAPAPETEQLPDSTAASNEDGSEHLQ